MKDRDRHIARERGQSRIQDMRRGDDRGEERRREVDWRGSKERKREGEEDRRKRGKDIEGTEEREVRRTEGEERRCGR